jgi:ectoine hydroxylase-related dioxygenase (phytanoyl-CoA dioxygenase family)
MSQARFKLDAAAVHTLAPTRDLEQADRDLARTGACIIEGVLEGAALSELRAALYRAAANDKKHGWQRDYQYGEDDHINQRIWNLPSHDVTFCDLVEHPVALRFVRSLIGWPALISSISANITGAGGRSMVLHADQGFMPEPWSAPYGMNVAWCIDDFTATNGATSCVPGSHLLNRMPKAGEQIPPPLPLEAPAGSVIVMDGRTWHTNGVNTGTTRRAGIFGFYTLPIYMPQENWYLSLNPAIRQFGSETLLTLFGFRPQLLGRINGLDRI